MIPQPGKSRSKQDHTQTGKHQTLEHHIQHFETHDRIIWAPQGVGKDLSLTLWKESLPNNT